MNIAVFSTDAVQGGAARAMRRLVAGLRQRGHRVDVFCLASGGDLVDAIGVHPVADATARTAAWFLSGPYVGNRRTPVSNTYFSAQAVGCALAEIPELTGYDILNVHWVAEFLSAGGLAALARIGPPVVFTLHDMAPFTGGCHYAAGCEGFAAACRPCPQLRGDPLRLTARVIASKREGLNHPNVAAVSPSHWLAEEARRSGVFARERVHVLPNAVEADVFTPTDRLAARAAFGLRPEDRVLLCGAHHAGEKRKGFDFLVPILRAVCEDPRGDRLRDDGRLVLTSFGSAAPELALPGVTLHDLGYIADDRRLALAYAAADVVVVPSREDNLPNIMLESLACGTPVAAFAIGGIPDVVIDGVNGRLAPPFDTTALARGIVDLVTEPGEWRGAARRTIEDGYSLKRQAGAYEALFAEMLTASGWRARPIRLAVGCRVDVPLRADPPFGSLAAKPALGCLGGLRRLFRSGRALRRRFRAV